MPDAGVFDLNPVGLPAAPIGAIAAFGRKPLEAHAAGSARDGTDLARLEWRYEHVVRPAAQQPRQIGLTQAQRQRPQILAAEQAKSSTSSSYRRECRALKSETPPTPSTTASPEAAGSHPAPVKTRRNLARSLLMGTRRLSFE
ncbi:hypothetical protein [Bradyrhizobium japonicum]|uniref:hypothetical protein n=1 Tax=Bradyrhizobium japonicum TaxID=375 RepID=UPI00138ACA03|nr:hypothetical protein [Bradyrhizobium japonicum]UQD95653.1 hypothetical protein JEY30_29170 [Bradyrhizobium japonicum]WLB23014.1 hypothetical protein QIH95_20045 [Bradyrhizobium japonicum]